ncbi:hypothetical protein HDU93_006848 [Gonapodya sp. JEL0774]|nr:hypothetical protein HDU93_006848 [Gonapodya sp. JEL0774]
MAQMERKYGEKLGMLMEGVEQVTKERDEALRRMELQQTTGGSGFLPGTKEKPGTVALRVKYENQIKKLTAEVEETRRKYLEANRAVANKKRQEDGLMKALKQNIDSLKSEKLHMLKQLKEEAEKRRMVEMDKQRESRKAKKLEEEKAKIQRDYELKLRSRQIEAKRDAGDKGRYNPMTILKRITTPKSITKMFNGSRASNHLGSGSLGAETLDNALSRSIPNLGRDESDFASNNAASVRATFKKEIVDGELAAWVAAKENSELLSELRRWKEQLVVDRGQLERELDSLGWQSNDALHYADELELADEEINVIDSRLADLESRSRYAPSAVDDKGYENALNILHSLDSLEVSRMAELLLEDLVGARLRLRMESLKCQDLEARRKEMLKAMQNMKNAGIAMEGYFEKRLSDLRERLGLNLDRRAAKRGLPQSGLPGLLEESHHKLPEEDSISVNVQELFGYEHSEHEFSGTDDAESNPQRRGRPRTAPARAQSTRDLSQDSENSVALTSRQVFHHLFKQGLRGNSLERNEFEQTDNYVLASAVVEGAFERTGMHLDADDAGSILSASASGSHFDGNRALNSHIEEGGRFTDTQNITTAPLVGGAVKDQRMFPAESFTRLNGVDYSNQLNDNSQRSSQYQLFFQEISSDESPSVEAEKAPTSPAETNPVDAPRDISLHVLPELRVQEPTPTATRIHSTVPTSVPPPNPFHHLHSPTSEHHELSLPTVRRSHAASSSTPNLSSIKSVDDRSPTDLAAFASTHSDIDIQFFEGDNEGDQEDGDSSPTRPTPHRLSKREKQHGKGNLVRSGSEILAKRGDEPGPRLGSGRIPTRIKDSRSRSKSPLGDPGPLKPPSRSTSPIKPSTAFATAPSSGQSHEQSRKVDSNAAEGVPRNRPGSALSEHTSVTSYVPTLSVETYCRKCRRHHHFDHEHLRAQRAAAQQANETQQQSVNEPAVPSSAITRPSTAVGAAKKLQQQNSGNDSQWWERLTKTNTVSTSLKIRPVNPSDQPSSDGGGHSRRPSAAASEARIGHTPSGVSLSPVEPPPELNGVPNLLESSETRDAVDNYALPLENDVEMPVCSQSSLEVPGYSERESAGPNRMIEQSVMYSTGVSVADDSMPVLSGSAISADLATRIEPSREIDSELRRPVPPDLDVTNTTM